MLWLDFAWSLGEKREKKKNNTAHTQGALMSFWRETDNLIFIQCEVQYAPYMIFVIDFDSPDVEKTVNVLFMYVCASEIY